MKHFKIIFFLVCITMVSCLGNTGTEPTLITDPSATTHLSIANQSDIDLTTVYKATDAYAGLDSMVAVPADSTTLIFEPGGLGFPIPSESLAKLSFFKSSNDTTSSLFTIEPVVDENWDDVTAEEDTVKKYDLVITEEDLQ